VALQTAVQSAEGEVGIVSFKQPMTSTSDSSVRLRNLTIIAPSPGVSTALRGAAVPVSESAVVCHERHLATVFGFSW